jgi:cytochrome b561
VAAGGLWRQEHGVGVPVPRKFCCVTHSFVCCVVVLCLAVAQGSWSWSDWRVLGVFQCPVSVPSSRDRAALLFDCNVLLTFFVCYVLVMCLAVARGSWRWTQWRVQLECSNIQQIILYCECAVFANVCVLLLFSSGTRQLEVDTVEATEKAFQCSANHKLL